MDAAFRKLRIHSKTLLHLCLLDLAWASELALIIEHWPTAVSLEAMCAKPAEQINAKQPVAED